MFFFAEIRQIVKEEVAALELEPEGIEKAAGIEVFQSFGIHATIDSLAAGDILKWEGVLLMPYAVIFEKMKMAKETILYQRRFREESKIRAENEARSKKR